MANKDIIKNWWVMPGFELEVVATGLKLPTNIAFVQNPDKKSNAPMMYVTELYGNVKLITNKGEVKTYAENLLNYSPDGKFPGTGESGLTGICIEPKSGDLFLSMIYQEGKDMKNKLIRTISSGDKLKIKSSKIIIDKIPSVKAAHQIQALSVGFDEKLYVNIGDGMTDPNVAQDDNDLRGKILRMELDSSVPNDNPNPKSLVFAKGFRNPFGAVWRKSNNSLYVSDNGPSQDDRIARVEAGKNYGWPKSMRQNSLFWWEFPQAPTALDFMQNNSFPEEYNDELFVALFGSAYVKGKSIKGKKIVKIRLNKNSDGITSYDEFVTYTGEGAESPCGLAFGHDGLYFTDLHGGNIYKVKAKQVLFNKP